MGWAPAAATSAAAALSSNTSKHPRSYRGDEQPMKRHRAGVDGGAPKAQEREGGMCDDGPMARREAPWSSQEKSGINKMLISLLPSGSDPQVLPLPDSILRVLQENQTGHGGEDGELEIDVYALGDDALGVIENRVGAYLADRVRLDERVLLPIEKEDVTKKAPSEVVTKKAETRIPPKAAVPRSKKESVTKIAPTRIPPKAAPPLPAPPKTPSTDISSRDGRQWMAFCFCC